MSMSPKPSALPIATWVATICLALALPGCQTAPQMSGRELNQNLRVMKYQKQMKEQEARQDWAGRLETARALAAAAPDSLFVETRVLALDAVQDYVDFHGTNTALDAEAERYYAEGLARADSTQRAQLYHMMALHHSMSGRNGAALPYLQLELEHWKAVDDRLQVLLAYNGIASVHNDRGDAALRDVYRQKALDLAGEHFEVGVRPPPGQAWISYSEMLKMRMDNIAAAGRSEEILSLWEKLEPIYDQYLEFDYKGPKAVAELLAISGDVERADRFMRDARGLAEKAIARHPELADGIRNELRCSAAMLDRHAERWQAARSGFEACFALQGAIGMERGISGGRALGLAYEKLGLLPEAIETYRAAIETAERTRASYEIAQRATFFRSIVRSAYWGLIRCLVRQAESSGDERIFLEALSATEQVRGRQLGELLDSEAGAAGSLESLALLRSSLPEGTIVLGYMLTDQEIVVLAFTRSRWIARLLEVDAAAFRARARGLSRALADPGSSADAIEVELAAMGAALLEPVRPLLRDARAVIALSDGAMNLVPFDLLSEPGSGGRPLLATRAVTLLPTLRLLDVARAEEPDRADRRDAEPGKLRRCTGRSSALVHHAHS
jgi:tetratricopeptide (TPR) repeat protein